MPLKVDSFRIQGPRVPYETPLNKLIDHPQIVSIITLSNAGPNIV